MAVHGSLLPLPALRINDLATFLIHVSLTLTMLLLSLENYSSFKTQPAHQLFCKALFDTTGRVRQPFSVLRFHFLCLSLTILSLLTLSCGLVAHPFQLHCVHLDWASLTP